MRLTNKMVAVAGMLAGLMLTAQTASAGCGPDVQRAGFRPAVYHPGEDGDMLRTHFDFFAPYNTSDIAGLWKFEFTASGNTGPNAPAGALPIPDGAPVDAGYVTWHDDGTELMNSGRAPASGSFCMGAWKQVKFDTYKLNHWALSWIPDYHPGQTQSFSELPGGVDESFKALGPTNILETVTLARGGTSYSGTFRLTQYVNDGASKPITDTAGAPVAFVIVGKITATRITP
jgi:hypothetical protein